MRITFVKKILADGRACPKCAEVERRLIDAGHMALIDHIVIADERDPDSEGMRLAARLGVERAPFFVVEKHGETTAYTVYFKFVKEVLGTPERSVVEARELLGDNPDLDLI